MLHKENGVFWIMNQPEIIKKCLRMYERVLTAIADN